MPQIMACTYATVLVAAVVVAYYAGVQASASQPTGVDGIVTLGSAPAWLWWRCKRITAAHHGIARLVAVVAVGAATGGTTGSRFRWYQRGAAITGTAITFAEMTNNGTIFTGRKRHDAYSARHSAGFYRNGTDLEQAGRWRDGSLVRWRDNSIASRLAAGVNARHRFATNPVRGMHTWESAKRQRMVGRWII